MILFIYLVKLVAYTGLFCVYYLLFLRNKNFHQYNRVYLLVSMIFSIVLPLIRLPLLASGNENQVISITLDSIAFGGWKDKVVVTAKQSPADSFITAQNIIASIYIAGLLLAVYPMLRSLAYMKSLALKYNVKALDTIQLYNTNEPGTPFSFFNTIYWNSSLSMETEEGRQIFRHEWYHVTQKHSYDNLFMRLTYSILWFNPFCYLIYKELKVIHEFMADKYAASGNDKHQYAALLVMQAVSPKQISISNQFFYNQIKRRIAMILQNNTSNYSSVRMVMAVPVVLIMFCACSLKNKDEAIANSQKTVDAADKVYEKPEMEASFPSGPVGWMRFMNKTLRYPQEAFAKRIQGTVIVTFTVQKDGSLSNIKAENVPSLKEVHIGLKGVVVHAITKEKKVEAAGTTDEEEVLRNEAVRVISKSGKWTPATANGRIVASLKKQPITFKLEESEELTEVKADQPAKF